jgi:type I restriction enzyme S subunit
MTEEKLHENALLFARTGGTVGNSYIVSEIPKNVVYLIRTSNSSKLCASQVNLDIY